ncbi:MAG: hypothetical protein HGA99_10500 [Chlorobiaceae bacterium]|jgi:hypothetical protein|nr:hypothetical protein [Chlorobiaceae bacterium]
MHSFNELVQQCTQFSLIALGDAQQRAEEALQTSAATPIVKTLQMVELQKAISAVGMFSMFDAILQDELQSADGFRAAGELLEKRNEASLKERFSDLQLAINVLKHGRGRSYDALVQKASVLPFRVKLPDEPFFSEGDVTDVSTLVEVDDTFLLSCAEVIREVSLAVCAEASHGT